ncbi:MAG: nucleotide exchange factor GrpE [Planctomycetes bacterium]|nr:nucleotide exchange factor GrpE [Planctomycetota bacterium]
MKKADDQDPTAASADDAAEGDAAASADAQVQADEQISVPAQEFEALKREVADWKERCLRSQAEFDNVRKRLRKEADEAGTRAIARFVKPILNELDNLERALGSATPEAFNEFAQGVTMIRENLRSALANAGIEEVPAEGAFDPSLHEAIAEEERDDIPRGHIAKVHRPGFRLKDQLVRSAQVVVAKPKSPGPPPA